MPQDFTKEDILKFIFAQAEKEKTQAGNTEDFNPPPNFQKENQTGNSPGNSNTEQAFNLGGGAMSEEELLRILRMQQQAAQNNSFEEQLYQGLSGIKKVKKQKRISRFNWQDGVIEETESGRSFVPGEGIVEIQSETEIVLDCSHPASSFGLGHISDGCNHTVCRYCLSQYILRCNKPGCFRSLCTVHDCQNSGKQISRIFYCKQHYRRAYVADLFARIFQTRARDLERIEDLRRDYYSISLPNSQEIPKALTYDK